MRILNLPSPWTQKSRNLWFASRLQYASGGQKLNLELVGLEHGWHEVFRCVGQLDTTTGDWEPIDSDGHSSEDSDFQIPEYPWRQDYSCIVRWATEYVGRFEIHFADPKDLHNEHSVYISRSVVTKPDIVSLSGLEFSTDGRWLFGIEQWGVGRSLRCMIARADVAALYAKPVLTEEVTNRLTLQPYTRRYVKPGRFTRFVTLPKSVDAVVVAMSPDNRLVATGTTTGETHLFRTRGGVPLGVFKRKRRKRTTSERVRRIVFSPSGKQISVVVDGMVRVWDVKSAELLWDAEDAKAQVMDLAYHPDGNTLAVVRSDGIALFLDAQAGAVRKRYAWKVGQLSSVAFSPDGLTCAAGGERGQVVVWDVDS